MFYINQNKLEHMLKLHRHSQVVDTILRVVDENLFDVVRNDKMGYTSIMAKGGGVRPALCVHTDTVGNTHPEAITKYGDVWRNADPKKLLGADDRAGCYIVKELLTRNHTGYHYLIFDWEETGGIGSSNYAMTDIAESNTQRTSAFIGLDRMGVLEMACYGHESDAFLTAMDMEDWKFTDGSFTDASNLARALDRCCVNMSVGYNNEHTRHETLNLSYLGVTINQLFNGLSGELYSDIFLPDYNYVNTLVPDYLEWMNDEDSYYTYGMGKGREDYVPVSDNYDENLDHLPADYWEGKDLT